MLRVMLAGVGLLVLSTAQQPAGIRLPRNAGTELDADFTVLLSMREVANGRVLLTQRGEPKFMVADFASRTARPIGRKGKGPGEYELAWSVTPLSNDTTVLCDFSYRWLMLVSDSIVRTVPAHDDGVRSLTYGCPDGADVSGRMLSRDFRPIGTNASNDSADLALYDRQRNSKTVITSLRLHAPLTDAPQAVAVPGGGVGWRRVPLNVPEQGLLFPDGWVAVVRMQPYRVDWRSPDGAWVRGRPLPGTPVPFTQRERDFYARGRTYISSAPVWPREVPPYDESGALQVTPDGMLAINRLPTANARNGRVDIVDRTGTLRAVIMLGERERILGFGAASVYVVRTDDDDLEYLRRHPWPRVGRLIGAAGRDPWHGPVGGPRD